MKRFKKSLIVAGATIAVGASVLGGVSAVSAATNTDGRDTLADKIASKFNLNKDEVKAVFEENKAEHQAEHKAKVEENLSQAVTDGKLTEDQKSKITAKMDELKTQFESERDAMKDKTHEERKAVMEQRRTELEKWATDNGIPTEYLKFAGPGKHGHMGHGPGSRDQGPEDQPTSEQ